MKRIVARIILGSFFVAIFGGMGWAMVASMGWLGALMSMGMCSVIAVIVLIWMWAVDNS